MPVTGGEDVSRQQQPRLYNLLENLCISRGITMPKLKVMDSDALNAFATGLNQRSIPSPSPPASLKAPQRSGDRGSAGPRAHPHPQRRRAADGGRDDHRGVVGFAAELFFRLFFYSNWNFGGGRSSSAPRRRQTSNSKGGGGGAIVAVILAVALLAVAWALSLVVRLALSRSRELLADAGSVELTKNPTP